MKKRSREDERLERLIGEMVEAAVMSEEEIEAVATSPFLYCRLRNHIKRQVGEKLRRSDRRVWAAGKVMKKSAARGETEWGEVFDSRPVRRALPGLTPGPANSRRFSPWAWAAAVMLAILALTAPRLMRALSSAPPESARETPFAQRPTPSSREDRVQPIKSSEPGLASQSSPTSVTQRTRRRTRAGRARDDAESTEIATDYFPLTYFGDPALLESRQVVRVEIPHSALLSFGLPVNLEHASEPVKAEILLGEDGLARAIRFLHSR